MKKIEVPYAPPFYYFDMNNEKDSEFIESLNKFFTLVYNPTININDIKPRRYYITKETDMDTRTGEIGDYNEMRKRIDPKFLMPVDIANLSKANQDRWRKGELDKIGRNHKCPCGSGKRFKRCCMGREF